LIFPRKYFSFSKRHIVLASAAGCIKIRPRAFTAIIDSNVTTLIAAVVLWYFGTGAIQGFAVTLFLGVVLSLITALFITKVLLNALVGMGVTNIKLFGAKSADKQ